MVPRLCEERTPAAPCRFRLSECRQKAQCDNFVQALTTSTVNRFLAKGPICLRNAYDPTERLQGAVNVQVGL
jgi:hypothetical protein